MRTQMSADDDDDDDADDDDDHDDDDDDDLFINRCSREHMREAIALKQASACQPLTKVRIISSIIKWKRKPIF